MGQCSLSALVVDTNIRDVNAIRGHSGNLANVTLSFTSQYAMSPTTESGKLSV